MKGLYHGFKITDHDSEMSTQWMDNYKSATDPQWRGAVERQIIREISNGRYVPASTTPTIVSALGAIPKPNNLDVRIIHDCSRPPGNAVNDLACKDQFSYQTIEDVVDLIKPSYYLAKLDLASAYRSVKIHPTDWPIAGLAWTFDGDTEPTVMTDRRLMFGARKSPYIFNTLSQAVCRIMAHHNYDNVKCYLDDFAIVSPTYAHCLETLNYLIKLLRTLGFSINYNKVEGPTQSIIYLGILLDTNTMTLSLPKKKMELLLQQIKTIKAAKSVSKRDLQSLAGRMSWACHVVYGGRFHLRRLIDTITSLDSPGHRTKVTGDMVKDLDWWISYAAKFNGSVQMTDNRSHIAAAIDASSYAAGGICHSEFFSSPWSDWDGVNDLHINYKEVLALLPALMLWAPRWANHRVHIHSDNQTAVAIINKGTCKHPRVMDTLRSIFWLTASYNIRLVAHYYPGSHNTLADACSRLPNLAAWKTLQEAAPQFCSHETSVEPLTQGSRPLPVKLLGTQYSYGLCHTSKDLSKFLSQPGTDPNTSIIGDLKMLCCIPRTATEAQFCAPIHEHYSPITSRVGFTKSNGKRPPPQMHFTGHQTGQRRYPRAQSSSHSPDATQFLEFPRHVKSPSCHNVGRCLDSILLPTEEVQCAPCNSPWVRPQPTAPASGHCSDSTGDCTTHQMDQNDPIQGKDLAYPPPSPTRAPPLSFPGRSLGHHAGKGGTKGWASPRLPLGQHVALPPGYSIPCSLQGLPTPQHRQINNWRAQFSQRGSILGLPGGSPSRHYPDLRGLAIQHIHFIHPALCAYHAGSHDSHGPGTASRGT